MKKGGLEDAPPVMAGAPGGSLGMSMKFLKMVMWDAPTPDAGGDTGQTGPLKMTPAMRGVSPKRPGGLWEQSPRGPPSTSDHSVGCHAG